MHYDLRRGNAPDDTSESIYLERPYIQPQLKKGAASEQGNALVHAPLMSATSAFPSEPCVFLILTCILQLSE